MVSTVKIEALQTDLEYATQQLNLSTQVAARSNQAVIEWQTEVNGLTNLLKLRQQSLAVTGNSSPRAVPPKTTSS